MSFEFSDILKHLPHRHPFLFVDKIVSVELGETIHAQKNVSINEDFFNVSFLHTDPNLAAKWLNDYVQMVERETSKRIVDGVNTSIENYRKKIQSAIDSNN